jgi:ATP-dependent DNA ligase
MRRLSPATTMDSRCSSACAASTMLVLSSLFAFDLLVLDGVDLRREPIETRKATLASLLRGIGAGLRLNEHFIYSGDVVVPPCL